MTIKAFINTVKYEKWCRLMTILMRLVVGAVFVFSGFTKAVDPWGTAYKVTEYLNAWAVGGSTGIALFLAVGLASLEFLLGVAIVVGSYRRSAVILALVLMLVLTPVTLWLAVTDAVPDCGCFGDAWHLSNGASLFKNVLLLLGLVYLLMFNKSVKCIYGPAVHWVVMTLSFALVMAVAYYGYFYQPLIDFRPYPVGTRIAQDLGDDGGSEDDFIFIYSRDGVERQFTIDSLPDEEDGWEYVTRYHANRPHGKVIVQHGSSAGGIAILDEDGTDITADVLTPGKPALLLLFPDLPDVGVVNSYSLNELSDAALASDVEVMGLSSATSQEIEHWKDISMASYPIYNMDDSELKMLARGNPAVVYVQNGIITWKRALSSLGDVEQPIELAALADDYDADKIMTSLMIAYLVAMLGLLVLNRTHVVIKSLFFNKKKDNDTNPSIPT